MRFVRLALNAPQHRRLIVAVFFVAAALTTVAVSVAAFRGGRGSTTNTSSQPSVQGSQSPMDRSFVLISAVGFGSDVRFDPSSVQLHFSGSNLTIYAGCNTIGGQVELSTDILSLSEAGGTTKSCSNELNERERVIVEFLLSDPSWAYDGTTLAISDPNRRLVFRN